MSWSGIEADLTWPQMSCTYQYTYSAFYCSNVWPKTSHSHVLITCLVMSCVQKSVHEKNAVLRATYHNFMYISFTSKQSKLGSWGKTVEPRRESLFLFTKHPLKDTLINQAILPWTVHHGRNPSIFPPPQHPSFNPIALWTQYSFGQVQ